MATNRSLSRLNIREHNQAFTFQPKALWNCSKIEVEAKNASRLYLLLCFRGSFLRLFFSAFNFIPKIENRDASLTFFDSSASKWIAISCILKLLCKISAASERILMHACAERFIQHTTHILLLTMIYFSREDTLVRCLHKIKTYLEAKHCHRAIGSKKKFLRGMKIFHFLAALDDVAF